ncbi:MAG: tyrosine-type recombinase/integrase [Methylophaga sp.]|nr:tyrosine-type recombinase/integrase [Methylophaga sp.]
MALTDIQIRNAKPEAKQYKLSAGKGLYLIVSPNGGKWWRVRYRYAGKQKELSVGTYPEVSLKQATQRRDEIRKTVIDGLDPLHERKIDKLSKRSAAENSFEAVTREWHSKFKNKWSLGHAARTLTRFEKDVFPWIGAREINKITAPELLTVLHRVESRGALDTAHRIQQQCGQVFRYAIATGRAERDLSVDLRGALPPVRTKHHASITDPKQIGGLLRAIQDYSGSFVTRCALGLAPYLFVRPGELRMAEWQEFDLDSAEWRIPSHKMKMRTVHIVPLSQQAMSILLELQPLTGGGKYLFPSSRTKARPMSENTINAALRRMGFSKDEMTGHGFRSMASTLLNEQGWHKDAIERQLAHSERDGVRAAYNYAEYLPERKRMMQAWADYLDGLSAGAEIISIKKSFER